MDAHVEHVENTARLSSLEKGQTEDRSELRSLRDAVGEIKVTLATVVSEQRAESASNQRFQTEMRTTWVSLTQQVSQMTGSLSASQGADKARSESKSRFDIWLAPLLGVGAAALFEILKNHR